MTLDAIRAIANPLSMGRRIRSLRESRGWRIADLTQQCGVDSSCICRIELGRRAASAEALAALSLALDTTLDFLLCGEDSLRKAWERRCAAEATA